MPLSKSDSIYDRMRSDILSLKLQPDAPLRLPALAKSYDIGMTPLRECLNRLTTEKFVVVAHNKGFRVSPLTRSELLDLERARQDIEGSLFAQSVAEGGDNWEARVVGSFHHLSKSGSPSALQPTNELELWNQRHAEFHAALISGASSPWMLGFCEQITLQLSRYHLFVRNALRDLAQTHPAKARAASDVSSTAMHLDPHKNLCDAALDRDVNAAQRHMQEHAVLSMQAFNDLMALIPEDTELATTLSRPEEEIST